MKKRSFASACLLMIVFLLTSCETGRRVTVAQTRQPKFISGIYLHGHSKTGVDSNAVDVTRAQEESENIAYAAAEEAPNEESEPTGLQYADLIGLQSRDVKSEELYRFISKWYGTHYRLGGEDESGIDCSAFSKKLYEDVYGTSITRTAMEQYKICKKLKKKDGAHEGDLVFFRHHGKRVAHVGVYLANDYFVHSSTSQGVTISNLNQSYWKTHYIGIGKLPKSENVSGL